jgi:alpha-glucuronidase
MSQGRLKELMPVETLSGVRKPSNHRTTHLEALGRLLAGIAPWLELGADDTPEGKLREHYIGLMLRSIDHGFDPASPDYLNFTVTRQPLVDAAFFCQGLLRAPRQVWGRLSEQTKANVLTALHQIAQIKPVESNWLLFSAMVEATLLELTGRCNMQPIDYALMRFKEWYKGDGWYGDGAHLHFDYYNSYVIHPMLLDVLTVLQRHGKGEADFYRTEQRRFTRYAEEQERLISPDGAFPVVGRSIAYRFGAFHVLSQAALTGLLPASVSKAQVRCALTAVIKRQMSVDRNFDADGWLTLGFAGHQPALAERYISTGSLYLCSVAFVALGLPADDEFWSAPDAEWTGKKVWSGNREVKLDKALKEPTGDNGYRLWLNYQPLPDGALRQAYRQLCRRIALPGSRFDGVIKEELNLSVRTMLRITPTLSPGGDADIRMQFCADKRLGKEGFTIRGNQHSITIQAHSDAGFLYAAFRLIRSMQCGAMPAQLDIEEIPAFDHRQLNHWDNLNGTIERGYAGRSLWEWSDLPKKIDPRYTDYARANASIGINGVVLNNVNADARILHSDYLKKVAVLADIFRRYNIRVYLSPNFASPMKPSATPEKLKQGGGIGTLATADPSDPQVVAWWKAKVDEIYSLIPDFGGFLVKANSEGMPGPQDYQRTHAEGANMLARLLKPHGGMVMWRTFVYNPKVDADRMKRSYKEFMPLDGAFDDNVVLQTKNGALDFQPAEPPQPLFYGVRKTSLMPELQITQEYLGHSTYLVYLLPMWKEFFSYEPHRHCRAIAGVANTGNIVNWTGHHFAQANWYAFGRLAWNPKEATEAITSDWIRATWNCDPATEATIAHMMMPTWDSFLCSHEPYGIGLTTRRADHYRAGFAERAHKEWFVSADSIGNDRTPSGSDYVSQYPDPLRSQFANPRTCPERYLLCFHKLPWSHRMPSGLTLRQEMTAHLKRGVEQVARNIELWKSLRGKVDALRHQAVLNSLLKEQKDAEAFCGEANEVLPAQLIIFCR